MFTTRLRSSACAAGRAVRPVVVLGGVPALLCAAAAGPANKPPAKKDFAVQVRPLVAQYCLPCHGATTRAGGLNLDAFTDEMSARAHADIFQHALVRVAEGSMPPAGSPKPGEQQVAALRAWLNTQPPAAPVHDPGRNPAHRLNRAEYNNTLRDLLGVNTHPADGFPADGGGGAGFDNDADTLFIPPILMERYVAAAGDALKSADSRKLLIVQPRAGITARQAAGLSLAHFLPRAFRGPVSSADTARYLGLFDAARRRGADFESAIRFAFKGALISPQFLFRLEPAAHSAGASPVDDYALASRLSYFLWSSMPDDTLFQLAAQHSLHKPDVLKSQVRRMLASPRAEALAENFGGQWLRVRDLYTTAGPDPQKYPGFTPELRDAMFHEAVDLFGSVVRNNTALTDLLDARYSYLNETLARHYGIAGVKGSQMRRVELTDQRRGGVLTMGGVLTLTSFPLRTSPVLRGKWVLAELLGTPPPPPPPGAGGLSTDDAPDKGLTFRKRLEQHRSKPECAGCHSRMDPLGFGLENFDAAGKWRDRIGGEPVDASGVLPTGEKFSGPIELKRLLLNRKGEFTRNLAERMLAYALGRGLEKYDEPAEARIVRQVAAGNYRSLSLIDSIVTSFPFLYRRDG